MGEDSKIEWTDHTFNPWIGCTKVSPGCAHCYAETLMDTRYGRVKWGKGNPRSRTSEANWKLPLKWNRAGGVEAHSFYHNPLQARFVGTPFHRPRVFCASLSDWLDDEVPIEWLADLLKLIRGTPNLDWLLLTKRPEHFETRACLCLDAEAWDADGIDGEDGIEWLSDWIDGHTPPENVWLGASVENQEMADKRIPLLLDIPAQIRFLSVEPMLGAVDIGAVKLRGPGVGATREDYLKPLPGVRWIICGGESGPGKRHFDLEWARSLRDQCADASVPFFFKQVDKVRSIPEDLLVREFPNQGVVACSQSGVVPPQSMAQRV